MRKIIEKINTSLLLLVYLTSFIFIKMLRLDSQNYIYISMFFSWLLFLSYLVYELKYNTEKYKMLNINKIEAILFIYTIYSIILTLFIDNKAIFYTLNVTGAFIVAIPLIKILFENKKLFIIIKKFVLYIFIITSILSLIMLICGYSKVALDLNDGIIFTPAKHYLEYEGEIRLTWLMSQKSRYAAYCLLGIAYLFYEMKKSIFKCLFIILMYINLAFTSSITCFCMGLLFPIIFYRKNIIKFISRYKKIAIIIFTCLSGTGLGGIYLISLKRNIFTLGSRLYIWESAVKEIFTNPLGRIVMEDSFLMSNENLNFPFTNGHNLFLNEAIERGIIGLVLLILIFIAVGTIYFKYKKNEFIFVNIVFLLAGVMEHILSEEMLYIFILVNIVWIVQCLRSKERKNEKSISNYGCV
ncbi:MAG: hypothetical protein ACRC41_14745 [Sarcina sp.]